MALWRYSSTSLGCRINKRATDEHMSGQIQRQSNIMEQSAHGEFRNQEGLTHPRQESYRLTPGKLDR
ncbi:MAG: hypothetical protein J07HQX50_00168 [Haloquadratum sp. J07HQX50]|nr:MAG: hypothetical protein J07HQX50_00168 [Haloquadratum sp. J07HQX50]